MSKLKWLLIPLIALYSIGNVKAANIAQAPQNPVISHPDAITDIINTLSYCESRNVQDAYVANDGGSASAGILQFKLLTFYGEWKRLVNPDFELVDAQNLWRDSDSQKLLATAMIRENRGALKNWWNCSKRYGLI